MLFVIVVNNRLSTLKIIYLPTASNGTIDNMDASMCDGATLVPLMTALTLRRGLISRRVRSSLC